MRTEKTIHSITLDSLMGTLFDALLNYFSALNNSPFRGLGSILLCVFALMACMPFRLQAENNEGLSVRNLIRNHQQTQKNKDGKSVYNDLINIAEDAKLYIEEGSAIIVTSEQSLAIAKPASPVKTVKKAAGIKEEKPEQMENKSVAQESTTVVVPVFPFESSSSSFLKSVGESAAISPQYRINHHQPAAKTCREYTARRIYNPGLSLYHPEQRQKLSIAATQCGLMTSFESSSPPPPAP